MDSINAVIAFAFNAAIVALLVWLFGSLALRFVGWGWVIFGAAIAFHGASTGTATAGTYALVMFNLALGLFFLFCGHALFALRNGFWKSAAARRVATGLARPFRAAASSFRA